MTALNMKPGLNGDTRETLVAQVIKLNEALIATQIALRDAAPHSRNYQHLGDDARHLMYADFQAWGKARSNLQDMMDYANAMSEALA
jgi:hypothetical protein